MLSDPSAPIAVPMFEKVVVPDGATMVMDGGIEGVQGHTVTVTADGRATWERRIETMQPSGKEGSGAVPLTEADRSSWATWRDGLWQLGASEKTDFNPPPSEGPPRWVWAIVMRRGKEVRLLHGGDMDSPLGAPEPAKSVLVWLTHTVDTASEQ
jgi:hypothetical protein